MTLPPVAFIVGFIFGIVSIIPEIVKMFSPLTRHIQRMRRR